MSTSDIPEWAIRCPWCHASPGNRCTRPSGGHLSIPSHDARITAWNTLNRQTGDDQ
ncbi:zinc finger domain-containing protein [Streptomyces sp. NPDC004008]